MTYNSNLVTKRYRIIYSEENLTREFGGEALDLLKRFHRLLENVRDTDTVRAKRNYLKSVIDGWGNGKS